MASCSGGANQQGTDSSTDFPSELGEKLSEFHKCLQSVEATLKDALNPETSGACEKLEPLDKAKHDLVLAYALNSLFWIYLNVKGENPQENGVKHELERIRAYMTKVKEIMDRPKAPRLDKDATRRFVRSSLWTPKSRKSDDKSDDEESEKAGCEENSDDRVTGKAQKRKR